MPSCAACDFEDKERRSSGMTEAERRRYDERIHDLQSQILELQKQNRLLLTRLLNERDK